MSETTGTCGGLSGCNYQNHYTLVSLCIDNFSTYVPNLSHNHSRVTLRPNKGKNILVAFGLVCTSPLQAERGGGTARLRQARRGHTPKIINMSKETW